jgi:protein TonB
LDRRPEPIVQAQPNYPFEMKRGGIEAQVRVGFIVNSKGDVILPYVVSATHTGFDHAAIEAVLKWKFRPGMKNGRKVNTRVEQPMNFTVDQN